jgi:hypothetical protein
VTTSIIVWPIYLLPSCLASPREQVNEVRLMGIWYLVFGTWYLVMCWGMYQLLRWLGILILVVAGAIAGMAVISIIGR